MFYEVRRRRQVRRIGEPHQDHFRGLKLRFGALRLLQPLQQELPGPGQHRQAQFLGEIAAAGALDLRRIGGVRHFRGDFDAGDPVGRVEQVL